jgi:DNA repair photolyase
MYSWVTHTHAHLGGECPHKCIYCYVDNPRFGRPERYKGLLRLVEDEFKVNYGTGKTIFIEHMNDLFCKDVPPMFIRKILSHCEDYPENTYVFQTKNPARYLDILGGGWHINAILGTTIESDIDYPTIGTAPCTVDRMLAMERLPKIIRKFVTIEPVLDFNVDRLADWIMRIKPEFLNLGADSKNHGLPEPTVTKIMELVAALKERGIELREKHNLQRLLK